MKKGGRKDRREENGGERGTGKWTWGKVLHFRGNSRHFPGGWRRQAPREGSVEPVARQATGESEQFSREFAALSREVETGEEERRRRAEGKRFEIAIANPVTPNNIRNALKDCASKPDADIAILYFSNGYADGLFKDGIGKYKGLAGTSKRKNFLKM